MLVNVDTGYDTCANACLSSQQSAFIATFLVLWWPIAYRFGQVVQEPSFNAFVVFFCNPSYSEGFSIVVGKLIIHILGNGLLLAVFVPI